MSTTGLWPREDTVADLWDEAEANRARVVISDESYQSDPIGWAVDCLGIPRLTLEWSIADAYGEHAWDGTVDPLAAICNALAQWMDVGVESGTGTGKSFLAAVLILWFLAAYRGSRVFTFAPKEDQLRLYIWTEISKLWPKFVSRFPAASLTDLRIRMIEGSDEWGAVGYSVGLRAGEDVATKAAGMHAEHMLLVYEETPGIDKSIMAAGENTCTAPHNLRLALGNPDNQYDALHEFCESPGVVHVRVSALDHPNVVCNEEVIPGAVSVKAIERRKLKYGEDSPLYRSRVRGISPSESENALIKRTWLEAAHSRYNDPKLRAGVPALGVDVANSETGDHAAIARGIGAVCLEVDAFQCPDSNVLGVNVAAEMDASDVQPRQVGVDSVGVGAGTVNKLKELRKKIRALNGGERPVTKINEDLRYREMQDEDEEPPPTVVEEEKYLNLRSQMWWQARIDLQRDLIGIVLDDELWRDLATPTWTTKNGVIIVESKENIKKRLGRSPNKGDAFVYWNWVRRRKPVTAPVAQAKSPNIDTRADRILDRLEKQMNQPKRRGF